MLILFAPIDGSGATNSSIGIAEVLQKHGHKIVFLVQKTWQGKLKALGFEEVIYEDNKPKGNLQNEKHWLITFIENISPFLPKSPIQHEKGYGIMKKQMLFDLAKRSNDVLQDLVLKINPDIILIDNLVSIPALVNSKIPWIRLCSAQVLFVLDNLNNDQTPPSCSGLSFNGPKQEWIEYRKTQESLFKNIWNEFNEWIMSKGCPSLPYLQLMHVSPFGTIYMYPKELDFPIVYPDNWLGVDNFIRSGENDEILKGGKFQIPNEFLLKQGKLVYFSMGTLACGDLNMMRKIVSILSKSPNKFIVSKGPLGDQLELYDNQIGANTLPQVSILNQVDMVITHGGNNTITEIFYYGKPMIVVPIFADQFDNAQRVDECGFGKKINAYHCTEKELLDAIQFVLHDENIKRNMKLASERIKKDQINNHQKIVQLVEKVFDKK